MLCTVFTRILLYANSNLLVINANRDTHVITEYSVYKPELTENIYNNKIFYTIFILFFNKVLYYRYNIIIDNTLL